MKRLFYVLAGFAGLGISPAVAAIITNGTFEPGPPPLTVFAPNTGTIPGWTVTTGSVDWLVGSIAPAPPAGYGVDLDGDSPGGISQAVILTPGQTYLLSFWLAGNSDGVTNGYPGPVAMSVSVNGSLLGDFTHTRAIDWTYESLSFQASSTNETIAFTSEDASGPYGPFLADVSVSEVPEPSSWSILATLLGGCLVLKKTRRHCASVIWTGWRLSTPPEL